MEEVECPHAKEGFGTCPELKGGKAPKVEVIKEVAWASISCDACQWGCDGR